ncbi:ornithine decarboxylase antizyme-domain-containing protein [Aspergillus filifer]
MARYLSNKSTTSDRLQQFLGRNPQTTILASCYSVHASASTVTGFHYCTTNGAGSKSTPISPLLDRPLASATGSGCPVNISLEQKGEAAHTIPGECERLFCDKLAAIFLGERMLPSQGSLGIDAYSNQTHDAAYASRQVQEWVEVLDYTSDVLYRGFITNTTGARTLFVFLADSDLCHGLKSGLIALFELASLQAFECEQIVACVPRSQDSIELEFTRNLGWCGFGLITLQAWDTQGCLDVSVSDKWLFLSAGTPKNKFIDGHVSCIRCSSCAAHLCLTTQIISKGFTGRHGRAYLVSSQSTVNAPCPTRESLPNTSLKSPVLRHLVTGAHTVSDIKCAFCGSILGWKYIHAEEESQQYKIGKFILETKKVMTTPAWDPAFGTRLTESATSAVTSSKPLETSPRSAYDDIEFDSQDEDECEDLFSGIWTPGLAVARRNRNVTRNTPAMGVMT